MVDQLCEDMSTLTTNDELQQEAQQGSVTPNNELQPEAQTPTDSAGRSSSRSFVITWQMDTIIIGVRDVKSCTRNAQKTAKDKKFCFESTGFYVEKFSAIFISRCTFYNVSAEYIVKKVLPKVLEKAPRSPIYVKNEAEQDLKLKNGPAMLYACWRRSNNGAQKNFQQHGTHVYAVLLTKDAHVLDIEKGEYFCIVAQNLKKHVIPPTTIPILQLDNKMCHIKMTFDIVLTFLNSTPIG
uniref:Ig-like domain-containing protein n=1 Tax=Ditylenchus dipsaci TaxID=166011 RepID=A0A915D5H1_9BILA